MAFYHRGGPTEASGWSLGRQFSRVFTCFWLGGEPAGARRGPRGRQSQTIYGARDVTFIEFLRVFGPAREPAPMPGEPWPAREAAGAWGGLASLGRPGLPGEGRGGAQIGHRAAPGLGLPFYCRNCIIYLVFMAFYHLGKPPFRGRHRRIISLILVAVCENR